MKRYKDFKIICKANQSPTDLLSSIQSIVSSKYECMRYRTFVEDDTLAVETCFSNLPPARIILSAVIDSNFVSIVNIVPSVRSKIRHIDIKEYNAILGEFRNVILPYISLEENEIWENSEDYTITDIIPKSYDKLDLWLKCYPLSGHPLDEERWYDFLIALVDNNERLSSDNLSKYIKESYDWEDNDIDNLIDKYEDQIDLLWYYVNHR